MTPTPARKEALMQAREEKAPCKPSVSPPKREKGRDSGSIYKRREDKCVKYKTLPICPQETAGVGYSPSSAVVLEQASVLAIPLEQTFFNCTLSTGICFYCTP